MTHEEKQDEAIRKLAVVIDNNIFPISGSMPNYNLINSILSEEEKEPTLKKKLDMPQDKTIKGVMERFDYNFVEMNLMRDMHNRPPLYEVKTTEVEEIKQFIQQEIKLALESVVPEERNTPHTEPIPELKGHHIGYNQAINEIKENIKHYLE